MLDSVVSFDVPARVRELELSVARRVREVLRSYISDERQVEAMTSDLLTITRDHASSYQTVNDRARIKRELDAE